MSDLISVAALRSKPAARLFDCRYSLTDHDAGRRDYAAGHIPRAVYVDLGRDMSREPGGPGGRHPLPDPDRFIDRLQELGVSNDSEVVCYDQNSGAVAARLWWMLRWVGHANVAVLDGGLDAWLGAGLSVETDAAKPARGSIERRTSLTRLVSASEIPGSSAILLDAREAARFRGESEPFDPVAGRIPGAVSAPFADNLSDGRFRSAAALEARFRSLGVGDDSAATCYCGSGVTAAHNILALRLAGFPEPALYAGSWSDWISDPGRPIAAG